MIEQLLSRDNLLLALKQVERNKGSHGVDGMSVKSLRVHIMEHWHGIRHSIEKSTYQPSPVRRVEIPKPNGTYCGVRGRGVIAPSYSINPKYVFNCLLITSGRLADRPKAEMLYNPYYTIRLSFEGLFLFRKESAFYLVSYFKSRSL